MNVSDVYGIAPAAPQLDLERDVSAYVIDGVRVPSVTEILKLAGVVSFDGVPPELLAAAAERGRAVHKLTAIVDAASAGAIVQVPSGLSGYVAAWSKFRSDTGFESSLIEFSVVNLSHRYAGTLDRFGEAHGVPWLIDLKTSASVPKWTGLQLAGYDLALRPMLTENEVVAMKRAAVRLKPNGTYSLVQFTNRGDHADFLACARVAHWRLNHGGQRL